MINLRGDRDYIIYELSYGVPISQKMRLIELINHLLDNINLFEIDELKGSLYDGEDDVMDLILPTFRRVFEKVFVKPPTLFSDIDGDIRLELFQLKFDIDIFNDYLINMLIDCKDLLIKFKNIDKTCETLSLIVDDYVSGLVKEVLDENDLQSEITKLKRDKTIKDILNGD